MKPLDTTSIRKAFSLLPGFLKELLQVVVSPRQGWDDAGKTSLPVHGLLTQGYIPFIAIVALTAFCPLIYRTSATAASCLLDAISIFVRYFLGYFASAFIMSVMFKRVMAEGESTSASAVDRLVLYTLATLALITLIANVCPVELALLRMLPLYVIYVIWEASWHMLVPADRRLVFLGVTFMSCVAPLLLVHLFFTLLNQ